MKTLLPLLALSIAGCSLVPTFDNRTVGSNVKAEDDRDLATFTGVRHEGIGDMVVQVGQVHSIHIEADENVIPLLLTTVEDDVLVVRTKTNILPKVPIRYVVTAPAVQSLDLTGVGNVRFDSVSGDRLSMSISGVGDVVARGAVNELSVKVSGVGNARCNELSARRAEVTVTGVGDADVTVDERLEARVTGVGNIRYSGHPKDVVKQKTGVGSIREG